MLVVREARPDDAAAVVPFLVEVLRGRPDAYRAIFKFAESSIGLIDDDGKNRPLGAVLERPDGSIAGFLGVLASRVPYVTPGWLQHLTSWAVAEDARSHGLRLLHFLVQARPGVLANFSGTAAVQAILPRFGFTSVDEAELTFSTLSFSGLRSRLAGNCATGADVLNFITNADQRRVVRDHLAVGCRAIAVELDGRKVSAILFQLGGIPYSTAQLIHLFPSDDETINAIWPRLKGFCVYDMRCPRLRVDARFAPKTEQPLLRKPRQMFAKNFSGNARTITRAFGEPLNTWISLNAVNAAQSN